MFKCAVYALGCKVNQCEAEAIKEELRKNGFETVDFTEKADIYIINTCCVTAEGERKSRQLVRRARALNQDALICVTGCAAQRAPEVFAAIEGVKLVCGNSQKSKLVEKIKEQLYGVYVDEMTMHSTYYEMPDSAGEKTRAFIKIQDGCNNFCSYCIIPYVRGRECSRRFESIIDECRKLRDQGYNEVVINGIHLSAYGKEWAYKPDLGDVVKAIMQIDGIERVRLGSLEPNVITEEFLEKVFSSEKFCPQFHLSLQSGADTVLKRMNRKYTTAEYAAAVEKIRRRYPLAAITTDVITGFPGETEEEFNQSLEFAKKIGFSAVHVFPFSPREGTVAEKMPGQVKKDIRISRAQKLINAAKLIGEDYRSKFIGKAVTVLAETNENGVQHGLTKEHISVYFKSEDIANRFTDVLIKEVTDDGLLGERII